MYLKKDQLKDQPKAKMRMSHSSQTTWENLEHRNLPIWVPCHIENHHVTAPRAKTWSSQSLSLNPCHSLQCLLQRSLGLSFPQGGRTGQCILLFSQVWASVWTGVSSQMPGPSEMSCSVTPFRLKG